MIGLEEYARIRKRTLEICSPLTIEDHVVQPFAETSPPKWHLAHTTWFYEKFILENIRGYRVFNERFNHLFNSYYKGAGKHWVRSKRGDLSRPGLGEILEYRRRVDAEIEKRLEGQYLGKEALELLEIGIHHEMQHQELLLMDIKAILSLDPEKRPYASASLAQSERAQPNQELWIEVPAGNFEMGAREKDFSYDNERPRHRCLLQTRLVSRKFVTNGDYLEFIEDGGYQRPEHWLSLGWDWVQEGQIELPLYWKKTERGFKETTLCGEFSLEREWPVQNISFFEADAFAKWKGCDLPSEAELEFLDNNREEVRPSCAYHALNPWETGALWAWTKDQYAPYPGHRPYGGMLGEYNRKFMCNQFVLRGGCFATPKGHWRPSYRNFYEPWQRWMFSGIRLAKDLEDA